MANKLQLVVFTLHGEQYGLDTLKVKEIARMESITRVPRTADYIEGVLNLRGQILPVVCLRKRFGLPPRVETKETRIIIVDTEELRVGLIVDAVSEVSDLSEAVVTPAPDVASSLYIVGVCHYGGSLVVLLDPLELFNEYLANNR